MHRIKLCIFLVYSFRKAKYQCLLTLTLVALLPRGPVTVVLRTVALWPRGPVTWVREWVTL